MQIKVVEMKYILFWYIIGKKKSEKRIEKVERMKNRENERKIISFFFSGCILQETGSPFIDFPNGFH